MTELDRIFDESQKRMDARYDQIIAEMNVHIARRNKTFDRCIWVLGGVSFLCVLVVYLVSR